MSIALHARMLKATSDDGKDGYRARNVALLRSRIYIACRDADDARRAGDTRAAAMYAELARSWRKSLKDIGEAL